MNSPMRLKILSTVGVREAMGQFCGCNHSKSIKIPTERQRKKDEEVERIRRLEAFVLQSEEREKAREEWMQAEIQR